MTQINLLAKVSARNDLQAIVLFFIIFFGTVLLIALVLLTVHYRVETQNHKLLLSKKKLENKLLDINTLLIKTKQIQNQKKQALFLAAKISQQRHTFKSNLALLSLLFKPSRSFSITSLVFDGKHLELRGFVKYHPQLKMLIKKIQQKVIASKFIVKTGCYAANTNFVIDIDLSQNKIKF